MFGINLFKGMTDDDIEKVVRDIFNWYVVSPDAASWAICPNIRDIYEFNKGESLLCTYIIRIHLYTYLKPLILAAIFNIRFDIHTDLGGELRTFNLFKWEDTDVTRCVFYPGKFRSIFIDDHIAGMWTDDIRDGYEIALLFRRWWINSLVTHYLGREVPTSFSPNEQTEFYKLLKAEIADEMPFNFVKTDHCHSSENVRRYLNILFESVDSYLEIYKSNRGIIL
jgi:hypothetical protein